MSDAVLKQLIESNAMKARSMLDDMAESRLDRQKLREGMVQLQNATTQLIDIRSRIDDLLNSLKLQE